MKIIYGNYIVVDPKILTEKPVVRSTRIPVDLILKKLAQNIKPDEILKDYPRLTNRGLT